MRAALETADAALQEESVPVDETERLVALHRLGLLDTPPSAAFDGVTRLAQAALQVPILCVSLVDQNRVWFKSRIGLGVRETPRRGSLCDHAVWAREPLIVRDASVDARFANDPLVSGPQHVRSYLGIPLFTRDRQPMGTLCAMDTQVRVFGEVEQVVMTEFAKIAEDLLSAKELAAKSDGVLQYAMEREKLFRDTFEQAPIGIIHTSLHGLILRMNQRACALLGYAPAELRELSIPSITHPEDVANNIREFKRTLAGEIDSYRLEQRLLAKDKRYIRVALSVAIKRAPSRQPDYNIVTIEPIAAAPAALDKPLDKAPDKTTEKEAEKAGAIVAPAGEGEEALRAAQKLLEEREQSLREARTSIDAREKSLLEARSSIDAREKALAEARSGIEAREKAMNDARAAIEARDKSLREGRSALEAREKALGDAQAAFEARQKSGTQASSKDGDKAPGEAQAALKGRDNALGEAQAAVKGRDKALGEAQAALKGRDKALGEAQTALKDRDKALGEAQAALKEREKALGEAQAALRERDKALGEAQTALKEREKSAGERQPAHDVRDKVFGEKQAAQDAREKALGEKQAALDALEKALGEKLAAIEAREKVVGEKQAALDAREKLMTQAQAALKEREKSVSGAQATLKERGEVSRDSETQLKERDKALADAQQTARAAEDALRFAQEDLRGLQMTLRDTQEALRDAQDQQREAQAALQASNAKLVQESANDALTVLPNRRTFSRRGEQAANAMRQSRKAYGLILLDVDNFKQVNEEYGHDVGDDVLRTLGNILSTQLRNSSDMAARLGGDEFAVLCFGDINEQTLHDVAERIHGQIGKAPLATPKGLLRFTGSFGLALSIADDCDWKSVYSRADAALREAKHAGKDRISFGRSATKNVTARLRALSPPAAG
jgi:diguanylate cyclase (GGDEF)-like protein/PAS domain S-box-containing protein